MYNSSYNLEECHLEGETALATNEFKPTTWQLYEPIALLRWDILNFNNHIKLLSDILENHS